MSRISSTQTTYGYLNQLNTSYDAYSKLLEQGDGDKLHRSSDDYVAYSKYLRYQNSSSNNDQYQRNIKTGLDWMKGADNALTNVTDIFKSFTEKVVNAGNSTNTVSDMGDIAKELIQQMNEVIEEMNHNQGDRYLFGGQSDLTMPFLLSADKMNRGETKTLNEAQKDFFGADNTGSLTQFLVLNGDDGNQYCLDINTGNVYEKDFVDFGYKDVILAGRNTVDPGVDAKGTITVGAAGATFENINSYFRPNGVIRDGSTVDNGADGRAWTAAVGGVNMTFATQEQYIAHYSGDEKLISMVIQKGFTNPTADTVNMTAQQVYGSDIFDYSSDVPTGTALLNEMLYVVAQVGSGDHKWCGDDGITIANATYASALNAQTTVAARYQSYEAIDELLTVQHETITSDINYISGADIPKLATMLSQYQSIYSLALSMGNKLFPGTLADYLR